MARDADASFKQAFESPSELVKALESLLVDPISVFYCPGSLLEHEYNVRHPVAFGMPTRWPVFFRHDQAYRLKPSFDVRSDVVSKYPDEEDLVASGWLLGGELLRDQANVIAFELGRGSVVALGSQVEFRTQTEATFKLLFNALVQGPADELTASELARLR